MRNTKIVATLGPSSTDPDTIAWMMDAGVDVFRLNASHGNQAEHGARLETVRKLEKERNRAVGVLLDLQGPKIRLGQFENGGCDLPAGACFTITTEQVMGTPVIASTTYADFAKDVKPGNRVLLADGSVELKVLSSDGVAARCEVVRGGYISDRKGINLPGVHVSTPAMTKKDMADLRFGIEAGIDMVALSFVRTRDDLLRLRHFLEEHDARIPIVAKIEKPEAWTRLDEILDEADGVMVARGDLGVEMALEKVPFIQKSIIEKARQRGKFVITATQMLESMIENQTPTRAEVSDVANAIYDGTDAVMLSAETSAGKYPVASVAMMATIARETDSSHLKPRAAEQAPFCAGSSEGARQSLAEDSSQVEIVADAAYHAAKVMRAAAIVVFTSTGATARLVARHRPKVPIYAFTPSLAVARQMSVLYAVKALQEPNLASTDEMMAQMDRRLLELGLVKQGDRVVFVAGQPIGRPGSTNMMKLHQVD
ncbi:MAG: pyruvate kinase [Acidobacteriia bacterium]|nr:pyruvate kinase [Terriglobia bacterium]